MNIMNLMIKNKEKFDKVIKKVVDKINLEIPVNEDIKNEISSASQNGTIG